MAKELDGESRESPRMKMRFLLLLYSRDSCDSWFLSLYRSGELNTRKGTRTLGSNPASGAAARIQGLLYYNVTGSGDKLITFSNGKAYWLNVASWDLLFDPKLTDATAQLDAVQLGDEIYLAGGYAADPANGFTGGIRRWTGTAVESVDGAIKEIDVTAGGTG